MLQMTTTIKKWGNSQGLRLPKEVLKVAHFGDNETVILFVNDSGILVQSAQKINTLMDLFENYSGANNCTDWDTGVPVGKEVL